MLSGSVPFLVFEDLMTFNCLQYEFSVNQIIFLDEENL